MTSSAWDGSSKRRLLVHSARQIVQVVSDGEKVLKGAKQNTLAVLEQPPGEREGYSIVIDGWVTYMYDYSIDGWFHESPFWRMKRTQHRDWLPVSDWQWLTASVWIEKNELSGVGNRPSFPLTNYRSEWSRELLQTADERFRCSSDLIRSIWLNCIISLTSLIYKLNIGPPILNFSNIFLHRKAAIWKPPIHRGKIESFKIILWN